MGDIVWVLTIEHRHGHDTSVHQSEDGARNWLAEYVREWWNDGGWLDDEQPPEDDSEAIDLYFEKVGDEYYSLDQCAVLP